MNSTMIAALGCKTYRVYGLNSKAWREARTQNASSSPETQKSKITEAIIASLSEDAGGFGTAGFHKNKLENVRQLYNQSNDHTTVFRAELVPCNPGTGEPLNALEVATASKDNNGEQDANGDSGNSFSGNDAIYASTASSRFQIHVKVSHAAEGVYKHKLQCALYARGREAAIDGASTSEGCIGDVPVADLINADEELKELNDKVISFQVNDDMNTKSGAIDTLQGFYVEVMLLEPNITEDDFIIGPPTQLDKTTPLFRADHVSKANINSGGSSVFQSVYMTPQFNTLAGPWEKANIQAFNVVALDIQKALVRVELPEFKEGCKNKTFREVYQLNARLKAGSFATVCRGTHRATGRKVAVKCVLRDELPPNDDAAIYDEVLILSTLRHPLICPLIDFFEERECYFLVMELMAGGDLFDRIGEKKNYNEKDARTLCKKMIESVCYCHENSVAHRDMKPKNLLLIDEEDDCAVKLADFGFATRVYEPCSLTKQCGTPFFIAPEVLLRSPYDERSDMWSVGVIAYLLLAGDVPFTGRTQKELFQNIVRGDVQFPDEAWGNVSKEAKDLLRKLLVTDPSRRLTSSQAMRSKWMIQHPDRLKRNSLVFASQRIKTFNARMKLRSAMIAVTAVSSARLSISRSLKNNMLDDDEIAGSEKESDTESEAHFLSLEEEDDDKDDNSEPGAGEGIKDDVNSGLIE